MKNKNACSIELNTINTNDKKNRHRQKNSIQSSTTSNWLLRSLLNYLCHEKYTIHFQNTKWIYNCPYEMRWFYFTV